MVNISGTISKVMGTVEKNADLAAAAVAIYGRFREDTPTPLVAISDYFTGKSTWNVMSEIQQTFTDPLGIVQLLKWKLWQSNHVPTNLIKAGLALYAGSELGILPGKYSTIGKKVAKGAVVAALLIPGSPPESQAAFINKGAKPLSQVLANYNY